MIKLLVVFVIMLLRNRKEESDWSESSEACSSLIKAVRNMFIQTKIKWMASLWIFLIVAKNVTFWNEGNFTLTSSVQAVPIIFKWNDLQSFGKALVDL